MTDCPPLTDTGYVRAMVCLARQPSGLDDRDFLTGFLPDTDRHRAGFINYRDLGSDKMVVQDRLQKLVVDNFHDAQGRSVTIAAPLALNAVTLGNIDDPSALINSNDMSALMPVLVSNLDRLDNFCYSNYVDGAPNPYKEIIRRRFEQGIKALQVALITGVAVTPDTTVAGYAGALPPFDWRGHKYRGSGRASAIDFLVNIFKLGSFSDGRFIVDNPSNPLQVEVKRISDDRLNRAFRGIGNLIQAVEMVESMYLDTMADPNNRPANFEVSYALSYTALVAYSRGANRDRLMQALANPTDDAHWKLILAYMRLLSVYGACLIQDTSLSQGSGQALLSEPLTELMGWLRDVDNVINLNAADEVWDVNLATAAQLAQVNIQVLDIRLTTLRGYYQSLDNGLVMPPSSAAALMDKLLALNEKALEIRFKAMRQSLRNNMPAVEKLFDYTLKDIAYCGAQLRGAQLSYPVGNPKAFIRLASFRPGTNNPAEEMARDLKIPVASAELESRMFNNRSQQWEDAPRASVAVPGVGATAAEARVFVLGKVWESPDRTYLRLWATLELAKARVDLDSSKNVNQNYRTAAEQITEEVLARDRIIYGLSGRDRSPQESFLYNQAALTLVSLFLHIENPRSTLDIKWPRGFYVEATGNRMSGLWVAGQKICEAVLLSSKSDYLRREARRMLVRCILKAAPYAKNPLDYIDAALRAIDKHAPASNTLLLKERAELLGLVGQAAGNMGLIDKAEEVYQQSLHLFEQLQKDKVLDRAPAYRRAYVNAIISFASLEINWQKLSTARGILDTIWDFAAQAPRATVWGDNLNGGGWYRNVTGPDPSFRFMLETDRVSMYKTMLDYYQQLAPLRKDLKEVEKLPAGDPLRFYTDLMAVAVTIEQRLESDSQMHRQNVDQWTVLNSQWKLLRAQVLGMQPPADDNDVEQSTLDQIDAIYLKVREANQDEPDRFYLMRDAQQGVMRNLARGQYSGLRVGGYTDNRMQTRDVYLDYGRNTTAEELNMARAVSDNEQRAIFAGRMATVNDLLAYRQTNDVEAMVVYALENYYNQKFENLAQLKTLLERELAAVSEASGTAQGDTEGSKTLVGAVITLTTLCLQTGEYARAGDFLSLIVTADGSLNSGVSALYQANPLELQLLQAQAVELSVTAELNSLDPLAAAAEIEAKVLSEVLPRLRTVVGTMDRLKAAVHVDDENFLLYAGVQLSMVRDDLIAYLAGIDPELALSLMSNPQRQVTAVNSDDPSRSVAQQVLAGLQRNVEELLKNPYLIPAHRYALAARRVSFRVRAAFVQADAAATEQALADLVLGVEASPAKPERVRSFLFPEFGGTGIFARDRLLSEQLTAQDIARMLADYQTQLGPQPYRYVELDLLEVLRIYAQLHQDHGLAAMLPPFFLRAIERPLPADLTVKAHLNLAHLRAMALYREGQARSAGRAEQAVGIINNELPEGIPIPVGLVFQVEALRADLWAYAAMKSEEEPTVARGYATKAWEKLAPLSVSHIPGVYPLDRLRMRIRQVPLGPFLGYRDHSVAEVEAILSDPEFAHLSGDERWVSSYRMVHALWSGAGASTQKILQSEGLVRNLLDSAEGDADGMPFEIRLALTADLFHLHVVMRERGIGQISLATLRRDKRQLFDTIFKNADAGHNLPRARLRSDFEFSEIFYFLRRELWRGPRGLLSADEQLLTQAEVDDFDAIFNKVALFDHQALGIRVSDAAYCRQQQLYAPALELLQDSLAEAGFGRNLAVLSPDSFNHLPLEQRRVLAELLLELGRVYRDRNRGDDLAQALAAYRLMLGVRVGRSSAWLRAQAEKEYADLILFSAARVPGATAAWRELSAGRGGALIFAEQYPKLALQRTFYYYRLQAWAKLMNAGADTKHLQGFEEKLLALAARQTAPSSVSPQRYRQWADAYAYQTVADLWFALGQPQPGMDRYERALNRMPDDVNMRLAYAQRLDQALAKMTVLSADYPAAVAALRLQVDRILAEDPQHIEALRMRARHE